MKLLHTVAAGVVTGNLVDPGHHTLQGTNGVNVYWQIDESTATTCDANCNKYYTMTCIKNQVVGNSVTSSGASLQSILLNPLGSNTGQLPFPGLQTGNTQTTLSIDQCIAFTNCNPPISYLEDTTQTTISVPFPILADESLMDYLDRLSSANAVDPTSPLGLPFSQSEPWSLCKIDGYTPWIGQQPLTGMYFGVGEQTQSAAFTCQPGEGLCPPTPTPSTCKDLFTKSNDIVCSYKCVDDVCQCPEGWILQDIATNPDQNKCVPNPALITFTCDHLKANMEIDKTIFGSLTDEQYTELADRLYIRPVSDSSDTSCKGPNAPASTPGTWEGITAPITFDATDGDISFQVCYGECSFKGYEGMAIDPKDGVEKPAIIYENVLRADEVKVGSIVVHEAFEMPFKCIAVKEHEASTDVETFDTSVIQQNLNSATVNMVEPGYTMALYKESTRSTPITADHAFMIGETIYYDITRALGLFGTQFYAKDCYVHANGEPITNTAKSIQIIDNCLVGSSPEAVGISPTVSVAGTVPYAAQFNAFAFSSTGPGELTVTCHLVQCLDGNCPAPGAAC